MAVASQVEGAPREPASRWSNPWHLRVFVSDRGAPRARRATDGLLLAVALLAVVVVGQGAVPPSAFEAALIEVGRSVPSFLDVVWRVAVGGLTAWVALLSLVLVLRWRLGILRDVGAAVGLGYAAASVIGDRIGPGDPVSVRLALVAAATTAAGPHLARPVRSVGRWVLGAGTLGLVVLASTTPSGALLGLLCGVAAAASVHLVLGSSGGRPPMDEVARALDALGVVATDLSEAERQAAGVFLVVATDVDGADLEIKLYGRDAWDAQVLAKAWRALWYRDAAALTLTRLQQAEHEAFATLLAARHGVVVDDVVNAGRTPQNDAVIVLRPVGTPLDPVDGRDRRLLERMWDAVLALRAAGISHGDLAPRRFRRRGDEIVLAGFEAATVSPTGDQRCIELAQLLVTTALIGGPDDAVSVAVARLGADGLAEILPYLQGAALGRSLRVAVEEHDLAVDDLRTAAATAAGTDPPRLARLHRVSKATLVRVALLSVAAYFLLSSLAGVGLADVADDLRTASWGFLVAALALGQVPRLAQAVATRGACPRPIAYGPVAVLQYAITFVNLVLPSTAARIAVNIRFFQRQGIPPASAVSIGAIDGFGGFVVQLLVLGSAFTFGGRELDLDLQRDGGDGHLLQVLLVVVALVAVAAVVALAIPSVRIRVLERVRPWLHEAAETLANLRSPAKLAQVIGGNLVAELLFASTLGLTLVAFDAPLPLGTLLVINVAVSLFAGIMPVPGGIGVSEGALVVGLTAAGVDEATAFAAAISYRMVTYYLPPIWGAVAFHRLERDGLL